MGKPIHILKVKQGEYKRGHCGEDSPLSRFASMDKALHLPLIHLCKTCVGHVNALKMRKKKEAVGDDKRE
jgi:hypothetical protein